MRSVALWVGLVTICSAMEPGEIFTAIRGGNPQAVRAALRSGLDPDARNSEGLPPLQYAVITAGVPAMKLLLDAGARVDAATQEGITALHMAAFDEAKTRLLLSRGATVDAATKSGLTPLHIAADRPGSSAVVKLLLAKGADPNRVAGGQTALGRAALSGDLPLMQLLLAAGAKVSTTPRLARSAAAGHCWECLRLALDGGADANGATASGRSALQDAAAFGDLEMVRMLVEKGADVQAADKRGYTPLMRAALSYEPGSPAVVEYLLAKGANPSPKNETGDTALSLAVRFGETPLAALLRKAGAPEAKTAVRVAPPMEGNQVADAVARSLPLLQRIGAPVHSFGKCISCHNNSLPAMVVNMARARGLAVDDASARQEYEHSIQSMRPHSPSLWLGTGVADINPYPLIGLAAENRDTNAVTDAMVHHVATRQEPSGRFHEWDYRPPQEYADITFTATALRALQLYPLPGRAAEFRERVERATRWLAKQTPRDTEEHALRLMGLVWGGGARKGDAVKALLALQREDGGWGQTAQLAPDAYATGQSLYALHLAGLPATDPAYRRGVDYLLRTQRKDGSWYVTSRSHPVQPLRDAGHPYFNHQWISAAGGAWSTMALLATLPQR